MHTGIRSAGAMHNNGLSDHGEQGGFNFPLNRAVLLLALPAMVSTAVVFNDYFEIF